MTIQSTWCQSSSDAWERRLSVVDSLSKVDFQSAEAEIMALIEESKKVGLQDIGVRAKLKLVRIRCLQGKIQMADSILSNVSALIDTSNTSLSVAGYHHLSGTVAHLQGNMSMALDDFRKAYRHFISLRELDASIKSLANIGATLMHQEFYEEALPYIQECRDLALKQESESIVLSMWVNESIIHKNLGDTLKAVETIQNAEPYLASGNIHLQYAFHANMIDKCQLVGPIEDIKHHGEEMLRLGRLMNSEEKIGYAYSGLAAYHKERNELAKALELFNKSKEIYEKVDEKSRLVHIYGNLAEIHERMGRHALAYSYLGKHLDLKLDLLNEASKQSVLVKEREFKLEQQKVISLEQELQLEENKSKLARTQRNLIAALGGLLLFAVIGALYLREQKRKSRLREVELAQERLNHENELLVKFQAGEEEERQRISRELHDNIGGLLVAAQMHLQGESSAPRSEKAKEIVSKVYNQTRLLSHRLSPIKLNELGLRGALKYYSDAISSSDNLDIVIDLSPRLDELSDKKQIVVYRSVQELITNAIKHGKATEIMVAEQSSESAAEILVRDNGIGEASFSQKGIGHAQIDRLTEMVGGDFEVVPSERGYQTRLTIPF